MHNSTPPPGAGPVPGQWRVIEARPRPEAEEFARTARITRHAQREYMGTHIVSEGTADAEIRQLLERFLEVGRLAQDAGGTVRVRSPKADGDDAYSFLLYLESRHIIGYRGPELSWFEGVHASLEDLRREQAERRDRDQQRQQQRAAQEQQLRERRAAHEERMREQQATAAAHRAEALKPTWPVLPASHYDRIGNAAPAPARRRPITDEARIRHVGRQPHVVYSADALNSSFFRNVPPEHRCEALHRVLDVLLRAPSKGTVVIDNSAITVTGKKVTMTLSPDCAAVRTLNPPRPGNKNEPPCYRAAVWTKARERRERPREPDHEP
ncbi:hypothetical protein OG883_44880 [Streptomyces sp. NBC_01142]|uniref:hypothetical protein n=1 Tax=Streptomyces sp. NBC_01142 TaxID=2975865 RepID=UPI00225834B9|nr:hypothetical protein [Streptomyces sp. NBC_01142]MCX4826781.1 hypothetical protein [Streptomyces sp. NBC_01142]